MKSAPSLQGLPPGTAWNEAVRRSMAICIAGFFLPNLLAEFGAIPQLHQSFHFLPGVCGAAGVFLGSLALFMGHYHRKMAHAVMFFVASLSLPYLVTWLWFRLSHPSDSAGLLELCGPTVVVSVLIYGALTAWHARQSNLSIEALSGQLAEDDYGKPKSRWQQLTVRVFSAVGVLLILLVLFSALANNK